MLVVGGGIAAFFAAIKARENGADVVMVDKGYAGKSGQSPYGTGFTVFNPEWGHDLDRWMDFTNKTSEYLNNREATEITLRKSYDRYLDLISWGVEFVSDENGKPICNPVPPGIASKLDFKQDRRGAYADKVRKHALEIGVKIIDGVMIAELIKAGGRAAGAIGISVIDEIVYTFIAKTVVLCIGAGTFKPAGYAPGVRPNWTEPESRGNHYREDYLARDDENWLAWIKFKCVDGKMEFTKVPVNKEWRPAESLSYRDRYPIVFPGEEEALAK